MSKNPKQMLLRVWGLSMWSWIYSLSIDIKIDTDCFSLVEDVDDFRVELGVEISTTEMEQVQGVFGTVWSIWTPKETQKSDPV